MDHCHGAEQGQEASRAASRQLAIALVLCALFVGGEVVGGVLSGSLAIMGDAVHMFSDLASFGIRWAVRSQVTESRRSHEDGVRIES